MKSSSSLVYFLGPTGLGKSSWALKLSQDFKASILNGDSVQIYKYVNIGTAKPTKEDRLLSPHYLYDFVEPLESYTAGKYYKAARAKLKDLSHEKFLFLVGGSGFYIQAFEKGMYDSAPICENVKTEINKKLNKEGEEGLWSWLKTLDLAYSESINKNDHYRVRRGLETVLSQGQSVFEVQKKFKEKLELQKLKNKSLKIGFFAEREVLLNRIKLRSQKMLKSGLLEEVEGLLEKGLRDWSPMKSVGYLESVDYLDGKISKEECLEKIIKNTMYLAKRQKTWFKRDKEIHWFDINQKDKDLYLKLNELIQD